MNTKEITICGKQVKMIYCPATENGFEDLTNKSIRVFVPTFGKDEEGNDIIVEPAKAHIGDFISLACAGIIAAYAKDKQDAPITPEDILYNATPMERNDMITTIVELRAEWYGVPKAVSDQIQKDNEGMTEEEKAEAEKNVQPPTSDTAVS